MRAFRTHVIETELLPIEVLHCRNRDCFRRFLLPFDLDLEPMTFIYPNLICNFPGDVYWISENKLTTSRLSNVIVGQTYRHNTERQDRNYIPRRFVAGQRLCALLTVFGACHV